jgi:hypothetical protein
VEWLPVALGVLTSVLATGVVAGVRAVWETRRPGGTLAASHEAPSSHLWDATVRVQWRGNGAAWNVLALPYDNGTTMAHGRLEAHVLRDGDGELRFQLRHPAKVALLWRPGPTSTKARGHLLDTSVRSTRPMKRREVRAFLAR